MEIFLEGTLHTRMIQSKLTPQLARFVPILAEETDLGLRTEIGDCQGRASLMLSVKLLVND